MIKIISILIYLIIYFKNVFATEPRIECEGLPGCGSSSSGALDFIGKIVAELIQYVAVIAVIALIFAGFMYIFSGGEEEKAKKARKWIIWSLIAVFISISGYFMINLINEANINI